MSNAAKTTSIKKGESNTNLSAAKDISGKFIALQFLDTGWRVALPILLMSYIGIKIDSQNGTMPLYSLIGFFTSLVIATFLVYRQITAVYPDFVAEMTNKNKAKRV